VRAVYKCSDGGAGAEMVFDGKMTRGLRQGIGTFIIDKKKYEGNFQSNLRNGEGVATDGPWKYTGGWKDGLFFGKGELSDYHGTVYTGAFEDGLFHGKGEEKSGGGEYSGKFVRGIREGEGKEKLPNGEVYDGEWKRNCRHGKGTLRNKKGIEIYKGYWKYGLYHGKGILKMNCPNGGTITIEGNWKSGEPDGDMTVTVSAGGKVSSSGKGELGSGAANVVSGKMSKLFGKKKPSKDKPSSKPSTNKNLAASSIPASSSASSSPSSSSLDVTSRASRVRTQQMSNISSSSPFSQEEINESVKVKGLTVSSSGSSHDSLAFVTPPKNPKFTVNFL